MSTARIEVAGPGVFRVSGVLDFDSVGRLEAAARPLLGGAADALVDLGGVEIRSHLGGDAILDAHLQKVRTRDALVAIRGDAAFAGWAAGRHDDTLIQ